MAAVAAIGSFLPQAFQAARDYMRYKRMTKVEKEETGGNRSL